MEREPMKCAFTGHREMDKNFDGELFERALEGLISRGCNVFYDGMARGFDLYAAKKIIDLKKIYDIKLVACIPYGGQIDSMREDDRRAYESVLKDCDDIKVLSANYYPGCMYARNRYMVDNADIVFAHFKGGKGGTYYTVSYAKKSGRQLVII